MTFLLDNLTAVIVGTVLLGALLVLQQRGQQKAVEAAQRYRAESMVAELATTVERELENARGRAETERAFAVVTGEGSLGADTYRFRLRRATASDGTEYTSLVSFPTLLRPNQLSASPVGVVSYHVEETGETARVDGRDRPLLRATRYEFPRGGPLRRTAVYERLVDVDVVALGAGGSETDATDAFSETPVRIRLAIESAPEVTRALTTEGAGPLTAIRHGRTVRIAGGSTTTAGSTPVDLSVRGGIPALPGDPTYDPSVTPAVAP